MIRLAYRYRVFMGTSVLFIIIDQVILAAPQTVVWKYIFCNPDKLNGNLLVSYFGCASETGDIEFECSTTDKITFEQQLSDWINGIVQGKPLNPPSDETTQQESEKEHAAQEATTEELPQRSSFFLKMYNSKMRRTYDNKRRMD